MKWRGPGHSLNPARAAARAQARTVARAEATAGAALGQARAATAPAGWQLLTDDSGSLVAYHVGSGTSVVLAQPPSNTNNDQQEGEHGQV